MQLHPRVTGRTLAFVRGFEGYRRQAARLDAGGWTIGYGHTRSARAGATVSPEEAEDLLAYDLSQVATAIEPLIFAPVDDNAFDALVSFTFSVGVEAFRTSEVRRRLNGGSPLQAAAALELWRLAAIEGEALVVDALVRRRSAEKALFLTPATGFPAAPSSVVRATLDRALLNASHADAWMAAVVAQPPATDVVAPLEGEAATIHGVRRQIDARRSPDARGEAVEALAERLDALLAEHELESGPGAASDEAPPPPVVVEAMRHAGAQVRASVDLQGGAEALHAPVAEAVSVDATPSAEASDALFVPPRARRSRGGLLALLLCVASAVLGVALMATAVVAILGRPTLGALGLGVVGIAALAPLGFRALVRAGRE